MESRSSRILCFLLVSAAYISVITSNSVCNDKSYSCKSSMTCCKAKNTSKAPYGCCPLPRAVCCLDQVHCCPNNTTCYAPHHNGPVKGCYHKRNESVTDAMPVPVFLVDSLYDPVPIVSRATFAPQKLKPEPPPSTVVCPNSQSNCLTNQTCCALTSGSYGCCPLSNAVCCNDHSHCCPQGYMCSPIDGTCQRQEEKLPILERKPSSQMVCPDNSSQCTSKQTCCLTSRNKFGCCEFEHAHCCKDGLHCCPEHFTCNENSLDCLFVVETQSGEESVKAVLLGLDIKAPDLLCPDGMECSDNETCCLMSNEGYGCCPAGPKSVCCSDHIHCCPSGYTCTESDCVKTEQKSLVDLTGYLNQLRDGVKCPDGGLCPSNVTCCLLENDRYGCCSEGPNAVCCADGVHCCPHGYKCDLSTSKCVTGDKENDRPLLPIKVNENGKKQRKNKQASFKLNRSLNLHQANSDRVKSVTCPDGSACPDNNTCCSLGNGSYGCCPLGIDAVCCSDHLHCCPNGYTCDGSICQQTKPTTSKIRSLNLRQTNSNRVKSVTCPDGGACPDNNTCCSLGNGSYGCCPLGIDAVCCSDHLHCCPNGYTCDGSICQQTKPTTSKIRSLNLRQTNSNRVKSVTCPDGGACPDNNTCCSLGNGSYGCCPLGIDAVCCSDHLHCCPNGYTCDGSICQQTKPTTSKIRSLNLRQTNSNRVKSVTCPDGSACPDNNTCCSLGNGSYGCCPLGIDAVCCSDHLHCCPNGYTCDGSICQQTKPTTSKIRSLNLRQTNSNRVKSVTCPDGGACPDNNTCCSLGNGSYGCCPLGIDAVCCSDHLHCCPNGYTCDGSICQQTKPTTSKIRSLNLRQTNSNRVKSVTCPDGSACPDNNTCCSLGNGSYGCCPLGIDAVCCSDHLHCCPNGYTCDGSICQQTKPTTSKIRSLNLRQTNSNRVKSVTCPDGGACPDNNTCCSLGNGSYGCCPLGIDAVCCSDHLHCCPNGYTCDGSICQQTKPTTSKIRSLNLRQTNSNRVKSVTCPDGSACPDNNTCCSLGNGSYGCCPLGIDAVCCSDHLHCCPNGYTCDGSICQQTKPTTSKIRSLNLRQTNSNRVKSVTCPDGSACPDNNTCCSLGNGSYGCCPLGIDAVCCSDHLHCCPNGYTCDGSICQQTKPTTSKIRSLNLHQTSPDRLPANFMLTLSNITCKDSGTCKSTETCCPSVNNRYACCDAGTNAVCCPDHIHCCPNGHTCDQAKNLCIKSDIPLLFNQVPGTVRVQDTVCPDGTSDCPDTSTCCKSGSGYSCCPVENAVCCSDEIHCCPSGYKCDISLGGCVKSISLLAFHTTEESPNIVCPDHSECDSNATCCELKAGQYSCCPLPNAVCCSDHLHCCPAGYQCDVTSGICIKENNNPIASLELKIQYHQFGEDTLQKGGSNGGKFMGHFDVASVPCGESSCVDGNTCCGGLGLSNECCPLPNAVCCSDRIHCCPRGFECGASGVCVGTGEMQETCSMVGFVRSGTSESETTVVFEGKDIENEL